MTKIWPQDAMTIATGNIAIKNLLKSREQLLKSMSELQDQLLKQFFPQFSNKKLWQVWWTPTEGYCKSNPTGLHILKKVGGNIDNFKCHFCNKELL